MERGAERVAFENAGKAPIEGAGIATNVSKTDPAASVLDP
jgi:hypothetical protein